MGAPAGAFCLSDLRQSVFVAVDEVGGRALAPQPEFDFFADRPFLFAIRDTHDQAVLFLGAIRDPA
jgi:serine protease inhibitor